MKDWTPTREKFRAERLESQRRAEATRQRYVERFPGWKRSKARVCPRVVAGKRCLAYSRQYRRCICEGSGQVNRLLDHTRIWRTPEGETVFTSEPYGINGRDLAAFVADCAELGLRVQVEASSPWNPGSTVLVIVTREEGP